MSNDSDKLKAGGGKLSTESSRSICLPVNVVRRGKSQGLGGVNVGNIKLQAKKGTMLVTVELDYINDPFLWSLDRNDEIEIEMEIKKK